MRFHARVAQIVTMSLLMAAAGSATSQQIYPGKLVRIVVPYAPGGTTSLVANVLAPKLNESWGQPVIVDPRPGGNTIIGTDLVAKSAPDGYTALVTTITHVVTPLLIPAPYDPIKDFAPVANLTNSEFFMLVNAAVPANTLQEFIALAKSKPGQLNYASAGSGGIQHLGGEFFNMTAGVRIQHIPYKGSGPAHTDLVGGRVQMFLSGPALSMSYIKAGKLRPLAITGDTRFPGLPQVPTFREAGLPEFNVTSSVGMLAPAGTPRAIVEKLASEAGRILMQPDIKEKLGNQGLDPASSSPDHYTTMLKSEYAKWARVIKTSNIKMEQ